MEENIEEYEKGNTLIDKANNFLQKAEEKKTLIRLVAVLLTLITISYMVASFYYDFWNFDLFFISAVTSIFAWILVSSVRFQVEEYESNGKVRTRTKLIKVKKKNKNERYTK